MRFEWLLLSVPTLLVMAFAEPKDQPTQVAPPATVEAMPAPPTSSMITSEWQKRAEYDIDLAHTNIKGCQDEITKLQKRLDALEARCPCGQPAASKPAGPAAAAATPVRTVVSQAAQAVQSCKNGACSLIQHSTQPAQSQPVQTYPYRTFRRWSR